MRIHISDNHVQLGILSAVAYLRAALILLIFSPEAHIATGWCANQPNCSKACGALSLFWRMVTNGSSTKEKSDLVQEK